MTGVRVRERLRARGSGTAAQSLIAWLHLGGWDDDVLPWLVAEGLGTWEEHSQLASHRMIKLYWSWKACFRESFRFDY